MTTIMNNTQSILQNIIDDFSPKKFTRFFREISGGNFRELNEDIFDYNDDFFSEGLTLGEIDCTDAKICVSTFKTNKALSERSGKKAQYEKAKKYLRDNANYNAGIFIFYDNEGNFRFSLIFDIPLPNGKRDWSSFKRFTYFVSKEQTNKTFLLRVGGAEFSSIDAIRDAFSVDKVTKDFYREIANWYFWAMDNVKFPDDEDKDEDQRNAKNLIRLITRIIFVWFMKEKKLVPTALFDKKEIDKIINYKDKTGSTYYKAILQNLFFATLNTKMKSDDPDSRIFVDEAKKRGFWNDGYLQQGYYRYSRFIKNKDEFLKLFENIPFLNGGLFESLDKKIDGKEIRIDCFSDNPKNEGRLKIPDELFFLDEEINVDLSNHLGSGKNKKVRGLLPILKSYNFTIDENTPVDEEVALDPELLGKVFENLLASYNPETATTARKSTGSYYTPREIVEYMVNESLVEYLKTALGIEDKDDEDGDENKDSKESKDGKESEDGKGSEDGKESKDRKDAKFCVPTDPRETKIRNLFDYNKDDNPFKDDTETTEKIIDAIEKVKILDPACGSGAFPMGILHKLVLALHKLDPDNKIWKKRLLERVPTEIREETEKSLRNKPLDYVRKLGLIENCIYGVDIQEIAIQISKLRFFISLLVEQEIDDSKTNRDVRALPNLETKFVAANTLIGLDKPEQMGLKSNEVEELETQLFKKRKDIFYVNSRAEKLKLQKEEKELREKLKKALEQNGFQNDVAEKIASWDPFDQNTHAHWFDPEWMFGVMDGFDVVIGNPPYHQIQKLPKKIKIELAQQNYKTYSTSADIYCLFFEQGFKHLKYNGQVTFITSNRFCFTNYGIGLRDYLSNKRLKQLINLNEINVFESANVGSLVSLIQNSESEGGDILVNEIKGELDSDNLKYKGKIVKANFYKSTQWIFNKTDIQSLKQKIENKGVAFNKWNKIKINRGITTGANHIFIIDENKRNEFIKSDPKSKEIIRPILRGANIKPYMITKPDQYLIFSYTDIRIEEYPVIFQYLQRHKKELEEVYEAKNKQKKWYELRRCNYYDNFSKKKLVWTRLSNQNAFAISIDGEFTVDSTSFAIGENLEYLAAILNSKLILFYFKLGSVIWGKDGIKWFGKYFDNIPIPQITFDKQKPFVNIVDKVLSTKRQNPRADTKHLEDKIDIMVYKLYELTYEEVKVIDPAFTLSEKDYNEFKIE